MSDNTDRKRAEEIAAEFYGFMRADDRRELVDAITTFAGEVRKEQREADAAAQVPTTWLDSLLTGPDAVLTGKSGTWGCAEVEALLRAIQKRIEG